MDFPMSYVNLTISIAKTYNLQAITAFGSET